MKPKTRSEELKTGYQQALDSRKNYTLENSEYIENMFVKNLDLEISALPNSLIDNLRRRQKREQEEKNITSFTTDNTV